MLWTIAIILIVLWLLGFSFSIGGSLIHNTLLVIVLIVILFEAEKCYKIFNMAPNFKQLSVLKTQNADLFH